MAKNKSSFGGMADGLFSAETVKPVSPAPAPAARTEPEPVPVKQSQKAQNKPAVQKESVSKKNGRPRGSDLKEDEETYKISIYLTEETMLMIDTYAIKHGRMHRSEAIRRAIRNLVKEDGGHL